MKKQFLLFLLLVSFLFLTGTNAVASSTGTVDALINPSPIYYPEILSDTDGTYCYDAVTDLFTSSATPVQITFDGINGIFIYDGASDPASFSVQFYVNKYGNFTGGVSGNDLEIYGAFGYGGVDYDGLLLTGEVTDFGAKDVGAYKALFDFTFDATGGLLFDNALFPKSGYNFIVSNSNLVSFYNNHCGDHTIHVTSALTPIPIPSAFILLGSGLIGLMRYRKGLRK